jgi:hypothetical protein
MLTKRIFGELAFLFAFDERLIAGREDFFDGRADFFRPRLDDELLVMRILAAIRLRVDFVSA